MQSTILVLRTTPLARLRALRAAPAASLLARPAHPTTRTIIHSPLLPAAAITQSPAATTPFPRTRALSTSRRDSLHFSSKSTSNDYAHDHDHAHDQQRTRWKAYAGFSATIVLLLLLAQSPSGKVYLDSLHASQKQKQHPELLELENSSFGPSSQKQASAPAPAPAPGKIPIHEAHLHPIPPETFTYVDPRPFRHMPFGDLLSRYAVFAMCCFPSLVERAPALLEWALLGGGGTSVPGVKSLTEWVVKKTFFKQVRAVPCMHSCVHAVG